MRRQWRRSTSGPAAAGAGALRLEPVARPSNRLDAHAGELLPQVADVDAHDVRARIEVQVPDAVEELLPRERCSRALEQGDEEGELARRQRDVPPVDGGAQGTRIEPHAVERHRRGN